MIILDFVSTISSNVKNTNAPTLRAQLMAYLALLSLSAMDTPGVMIAGSTARASMASTSDKKKRELLLLVSLRLRKRCGFPKEVTWYTFRKNELQMCEDKAS